MTSAANAAAIRLGAFPPSLHAAPARATMHSADATGSSFRRPACRTRHCLFARGARCSRSCRPIRCWASMPCPSNRGRRLRRGVAQDGARRPSRAAVKECIHRVERALVNCGYQRPQNRVVINLAPADLPKNAASFDLPITLGLLAASGQLAPNASANLPSSANWRSTARVPRPGRAVHGHGRRLASRPAWAARPQPPTPPKPQWSKASRSFPSTACRRPSAF